MYQTLHENEWVKERFLLDISTVPQNQLGLIAVCQLYAKLFLFTSRVHTTHVNDTARHQVQQILNWKHLTSCSWASYRTKKDSTAHWHCGKKNRKFSKWKQLSTYFQYLDLTVFIWWSWLMVLSYKVGVCKINRYWENEGDLWYGYSWETW